MDINFPEIDRFAVRRAGKYAGSMIRRAKKALRLCMIF
jgi:hypothetical protein